MASSGSSKRLPIIAAMALTVIGGGIWFFFGRSKAEIKWKTAAVERGPLQVAVTATGTLEAVVTVQVGTQVSGTVSNIYADFNSIVKKDQVIARIDTTLLHAALADAQSNLDKADAQNRQAAEDLKRSQALFDKTLIAQSDLDLATANARVAAANLSSAKAGVDRARINLRYATIVSPIDGIVLSRAVDVGQTVAASFNTPTLFTIAGDLHKMQVEASVDEADIGKVKLGQSATFTVDAYPDTNFSGLVQQIRLQPVTVQNVVSYSVVISVPNPEQKLMPGMTANLAIVTARKEDVLQAPAAALRFSPWSQGGSGGGGGKGFGGNGDSAGNAGGWKHKRDGDSTGADSTRARGHHRKPGFGRVYVLENGKPKPIEVETGLTDGSHTEISGPIEPGTMVLTGIDMPKAAAAGGQTNPFGMPRIGGGGGRGR